MKKLDRIQKVKSTLDELEVLSRLKDSVEFDVIRRIASRYIDNLRRASFKLVETDAHYLSVRHAEFAGQALGIKELIKMVERSGEKLDKMQK